MIQLQFAASADIASAAIRWFSHGAFSHVDVVLPGVGLVGARYEGGVQIRPPGYATFSAVKIVEVPSADADAGFDFLGAQIGKPYDWTAIFGFASGRDWREDDSWFCSELAAATLEKAGAFAFPLCAQANKITPSDLLLILSAICKT